MKYASTMRVRKEIYFRDRGHFQSAVNLANFGQHRVRVGCVAAVGNKRVAGAFNTYRNDPSITEWGNATYHAERNALNNVPIRLLSKVTLYVARINQAGDPVPSCPCHRCEMDVVHVVDSVVYLDKNKQLVKERFRR